MSIAMNIKAGVAAAVTALGAGAQTNAAQDQFRDSNMPTAGHVMAGDQPVNSGNNFRDSVRQEHQAAPRDDAGTQTAPAKPSVEQLTAQMRTLSISNAVLADVATELNTGRNPREDGVRVDNLRVRFEKSQATANDPVSKQLQLVGREHGALASVVDRSLTQTGTIIDKLYSDMVRQDVRMQKDRDRAIFGGFSDLGTVIFGVPSPEVKEKFPGACAKLEEASKIQMNPLAAKIYSSTFDELLAQKHAELGHAGAGQASQTPESLEPKVAELSARNAALNEQIKSAIGNDPALETKVDLAVQAGIATRTNQGVVSSGQFTQAEELAALTALRADIQAARPLANDHTRAVSLKIQEARAAWATDRQVYEERTRAARRVFN